jgi:hypothetical protein
MTKPLDRRIFLRRFLKAGSALGSAMALARPAAAFTVQRVSPASPLGLDLADRCSAPAEHATIQALLEAKLAARTAPPGTTLYETAQCPVCGCMIAATRHID